MKNVDTRDEEIIRYILGEMSEQEQTAIEVRYFEDRPFLADVQSVRDDLVDAYVRSELPASRRRRLEQRMKEIPSLRKRVDFARTLLSADSAPG
jgi:anti-sigma factor RsiW